MEGIDFSFDASSILTGEEAEKLFEETETQQPENQETEETEEKEPSAEEEPDENPVAPEEVGEEEQNEDEEETAPLDGDGTSPLYSSIATALKKDGIFSELDDETISKIQSAEDFVELFEKIANDRVDEKIRRVDEALRNGVASDTIKMYEQTIGYLNSISEDALTEESDEADDLRKKLIYNDLINKGYSQERANREIEKSFKAATDMDDAKEALEALKKFYTEGYDRVRKEAKDKVDAQKKAQKEQSDKFKKMVLEDEVTLGDSKLDKRTCQKVFDAVSKPVYKDPETGRLLTEVQKFQQENPLEFLKQLGIWFVLTDGGKNLSGLVQKKVRTEKNKAVKELARKINTTALNSDGSLKFAGGSENSDPLLDDGWKVAGIL